LAVFLAGCPRGAAITCPPLVQYDKKTQAEALKELMQINAPTLERMLNDYGLTRDAIRKCLTHRSRS
jgi:hypothetical protein